MTLQPTLKTATTIDNFEDIIELIEDSEHMNKSEFIKKAFFLVFKIIPLAQRGAFFELRGDLYIPLFCKGYDIELLKKIKLTRENAYYGYEGLQTARIDAYQTYICNRESDQYDEQTLEIFKQLGTHKAFHAIYAPLITNGEIVGILSLENFDDGFDFFSLRMLKVFATLVSQYYVKIFEQQAKTDSYLKMVTALVSAIEVKDVYTRGHAERVQTYSLMIADCMNLSEKIKENISMSSILHDVGKIGIPSVILNKPGKLTAEEFDIIKTHPTMSRKIIMGIEGLHNISNIVYAHHEQYDGSGYPRGISKNEIPCEASIIQIADTYDAITSNRAYRSSLPKETAAKIIRDNRGSQFHPKIADVFLKKVFPKI
jgi:HD-GYP domain-containing protein (c-di-GMP phosphodiesterase class II)